MLIRRDYYIQFREITRLMRAKSMANKSTIVCPKCGTVIEMEAVFEKEMEEKLRLREDDIRKKAFAWAKEESDKKTIEALGAKEKELL